MTAIPESHQDLKPSGWPLHVSRRCWTWDRTVCVRRPTAAVRNGSSTPREIELDGPLAFAAAWLLD